MESKINVAVRIKPLSAAESQQEKNRMWSKVSDNTLMFQRTKEMFAFDHVFGPEVKTETIFQQQVRELVHNALQGFNQTVFAYGQTSSGKTFTMRGYSTDKDGQLGLIPLSIKEIFDFIKKDAANEYKVSVSYMEVSKTGLINNDVDLQRMRE